VAEPIESVHILGSREFGGADQFYVRLVRALHASGQPVTAINRPNSPVCDALNHDSIKQVHLPLANKWDLWSRWMIGRELRRHEPCVVQTYMGRATRLTRLPPKTGSVHVARLGGFYKLDGYYRHADAWVGNTRAICDFLVKGGMPANRVHHIGNFVPTAAAPPDAIQKVQLRTTHGLPQDAWLLFGLARLVSKKGFKNLVGAFARVPKEIAGRAVILMVAGEGPELPALKALSAELGMHDRIRWLGWQNPPDDFYRMADGFVCPSRHEPLGNVILEAWNHRCPVISTRNEGATELITENETGFLCDYGDLQGMADQVINLFSASEVARLSLASAGNDYLLRHFSQEAIVGAYLSLYHDMLARKA
jgi:glycosyltransferase involved in cell wall biosynthesis